uniref:tRNAHis guanylyltransferase catalytic domain-containing protein n=1 Tax=Solanum tuberosum TaxID=4113 RepID=M1BVR9_SOLTU
MSDTSAGFSDIDKQPLLPSGLRVSSFLIIFFLLTVAEISHQIDILKICFSEKHGFEKPNDDKALNLMNACAIKVLENFSDVIFAYGFTDEYRSYKQSIQYLFVEAGVFWKFRK